MTTPGLAATVAPDVTLRERLLNLSPAYKAFLDMAPPLNSEPLLGETFIGRWLVIQGFATAYSTTVSGLLRRGRRRKHQVAYASSFASGYPRSDASKPRGCFKPLLLLGRGLVILIFKRADLFYPVECPDEYTTPEHLAEHAALNPGTLSIEDMDGNVLWQETMQ